MAMVTSSKVKIFRKERHGKGLAICVYFTANVGNNDWGLFSLNNSRLGAGRGRFNTAKTCQYLIGGR